MHSSLATSAAALLLAAVIPMTSAQTYTSCNPLDTTCPADPAMGASLHSDFTAGAADGWTVTAGSISYGSNGAVFTIAAEGDAPTIETTDYFFFGTAEVKMQVAPGTGIVSSIVLESDDLDEVDWEALGGYTTYVETNYFGKGYTGNYDRSTNVDVSSPQTSFHTYTVNWQRDSIQWLIDGAVVRTLTAAEAGEYFPQTPMRLRIGTWAGGDPKNAPGTIQWAGGVTNYADGPFTAYVQSVTITNANPGASYTYNGNSGSADSIEVSGAYSASASPSSVAPSTTSTVAPPTSSSSSPSTTSVATSSTSSVSTTSTVAESTTSVPSSTSSSSSSSSSSTSTSSSSSSSSTSTSSGPSSTTATTTTPSVVPPTTFTSVASSTPTIVVPPIGVNTTVPSNTTTPTGTGRPSSSSTPAVTPAPQAGSAMPTASVTSSAVALYCFLFAMVAYAL